MSDPADPPGHAPDPHPAASIVSLELGLIDPNRHQPRQAFDPEALAELAQSIRTAGVMQPILVRRNPERPGRYELIAGERRLRAAAMVPLATIPAIVQDLDDRAAAEWALIENLQREDLNPIERAEAFKALIEQHKLTHEELGERVGLNRSSVTNLLRLNDLEQAIKHHVRSGALSSGHARALLAIEDAQARQRVAELSIREQWSVRELERRIAAGELDAVSDSRGATAAQRAIASRSQPATNPHLKDLEERLSRHLGTRVLIRPGRKQGTGKLIAEFYSLDAFDGLLQRLGFEMEG